MHECSLDIGTSLYVNVYQTQMKDIATMQLIGVEHIAYSGNYMPVTVRLRGRHSLCICPV